MTSPDTETPTLPSTFDGEENEDSEDQDEDVYDYDEDDCAGPTDPKRPKCESQAQHGNGVHPRPNQRKCKTVGERKEKRRMTNRKAAQKSREKEKEKESELIKESLEAESKRTSLRYEIKKLQEKKEEFESILESHMNNGCGKCVLNTITNTYQPQHAQLTIQSPDSTPSPTPTMGIPFASYNERAALLNMQQCESSSLPSYEATQIIPATTTGDSVSYATKYPQPPVSLAEQGHTFIPLNQFKELAMRIASEKQKQVVEDSPPLFPFAPKAPMQQTPQVAIQPTYGTSVSPIVINDQTDPHHTMSNIQTGTNVSQTTISAWSQSESSTVNNGDMPLFTHPTYAIVASEVDPTVLEEQGIDINQIANTVRTEAGTGPEVIQGPYITVPNQLNLMPMATYPFAAAGLKSPDTSVAVSALLQLNRDIVDNSNTMM